MWTRPQMRGAACRPAMVQPRAPAGRQRALCGRQRRQQWQLACEVQRELTKRERCAWPSSPIRGSMLADRSTASCRAAYLASLSSNL
jgi:hypothetical protein